MEKNGQAKRAITTKDTIKALHQNGVDISEKDAEIILDFLYFLAKLTVNQYINNGKQNQK
jgi:hypothetical protein